MSQNSERVNVPDLIYHYQTAYAYVVSVEDDEFGKEAERIYLDKNKVEQDGDDFIMTEEYAREKGLM